MIVQIIIAAVIAALAATGLLAILSYLRDAVRSGTEAREKLDCSYLGEISHERKYKTVFALLRRKKKYQQAGLIGAEV